MPSFNDGYIFLG